MKASVGDDSDKKGKAYYRVTSLVVCSLCLPLGRRVFALVVRMVSGGTPMAKIRTVLLLHISGMLLRKGARMGSGHCVGGVIEFTDTYVGVT